MSKKAEYLAGLGSVPFVSAADFEKVGFTNQQMRAAWELVGPTIARNMHGKSLQDLLCIAFMEGVWSTTAQFMAQGLEFQPPQERNEHE